MRENSYFQLLVTRYIFVHIKEAASANNRLLALLAQHTYDEASTVGAGRDFTRAAPTT